MKRFISSVLILGVCLTPLTVPLMVQPSWGQSQNLQVEELQRLIQQAKQQEEQGQLRQAIETWQQVLALARQFKIKKIEAVALNRIGLSYAEISQPQEALKYYNQALPITQSLGNRAEEAITLNNIGGVYFRISKPEEALKYLNQALIIMRSVGNRYGEAGNLNNIGAVYDMISQPYEALKYYSQALSIMRSVRDRAGVATTLNNIGRVYESISQAQQALEYLYQALPIMREVGDRAGEATTLNNIGAVYDRISKPQEALKYYNQALTIMRAIGYRSGEAATLSNIGGVYDSISQPQQALEYLNQALPIRQEVDDRLGEAATLNNIGLVYNRNSQPQEALKYYNRALPIMREVRDRTGEATTLNNLGTVYENISQPQQALKYHNQALPIRREVGDLAGESATLNNIGLVYHSISQPQEALKYYDQALVITRKVGDRAGIATTLNNIGFAYRDIKQPTQAIDNWEKSVQITLEMRSGLQRENRQKFLEGESGRAIALTSLLIDENQADRAFQWVNIATTADLADYTRLINAKVANPQAQTSIDEWNQKNQQLQYLRRQLQDKFSENLSRQMRELETEVNRKAEEISRQFPEVAELFESTPKDIAQLKASIPPDTVVIQPVLLTNVKNLPNTIALFVLTKDSLSVKKIPINPAELDKLLTQYREQLQNTGDTNFTVTGGKLYEILIRPIEDQIKATSAKQLSIIATGKLRYIPFETLYDEKTDEFLIQKYPVNYLTRISTRPIPDSTLQSGILALGNPVTRNPYNLPNSPEEVQNITKLFPSSLSYIGNTATLDQFKTQAPRFPFLHLATHGCFQPEGCCLLNSPNCRKPDRLDLQPNTILFADREFNIADAALLGLQNTRLLTLSACQTALQANSNGEEISGIAYVFERAGAKAVMASLWNVDDKTTKELMVAFYQNINKGMSKGEALRQAKLSLIKRNFLPFYWSPFILIGDAR
ncbi:MAG: tetratricopeptide repeat protein [Microcoleus sp. PH2017_10_PVI_O_A]|nr:MULTISPECIES: tetratricopeptide repeat protein [unclassified Microcoleus]MCC3558323.1 tetratricopeptide repeat protein [Microcoleus sp. PH2017_27_LUM_O_A]TAE85064.1 MAG: CHAT domain-containing protein [Oscillatoriales cyanobacterium]MCC3404821.1 tetratricopeptide repeat protein [Microcoleus sp. PH2017_10_PVI_O_A]MCC3458927.1 tetratricopeptide repeat protein [Microcoleus sp. PH2017_11_PCY_U_A]MCC3477128.1 tetratricopeptide repeat protein [Microcoleus sp. PH2017_12_PCY_D_A]